MWVFSPEIDLGYDLRIWREEHLGGEAQDSIHGLSQQGHDGRQEIAIVFKCKARDSNSF